MRRPVQTLGVKSQDSKKSAAAIKATSPLPIDVRIRNLLLLAVEAKTKRVSSAPCQDSATVPMSQKQRTMLSLTHLRGPARFPISCYANRFRLEHRICQQKDRSLA